MRCLSDGGLEGLSGGQRVESKKGSCIFDSGTSSHAGLAQREKRLLMRGWHVAKIQRHTQSLIFTNS